jgi:MFS family permease
MSLLSDRFPQSRLGFASGFYYMGVPIGVGASLLIAGYLGPAIGWRGCFYVLGAIGLALAVVMLFVQETPRRHLGAATTGKDAAPASSGRGARALVGTLVKALRFSPALTLTIAGGVVMHFVLGAATFDQLWYVQERGFERAEIARLTGWIGMIGGVLGNLFGGVVSDWYLRRTGTGRAIFLFWLGLVLMPFNIAYRLVDGGSPLFWIGVFTGYFGLGAFYGPTFSTVQELVPPQIRATVVAFYILVLNLIGLGVGITVGGWAIDRMIAAGVPEPYSKTLLVFTLISQLAWPLFLLAGRRFRRDRERLFEAAAAV